MRRIRLQTGQAAAEYMGGLLVVAFVIAALTAVAPRVAGHVESVVGCIAGAGGCGAASALASAPAADPPVGVAPIRPRFGRVVCPFAGPGCWRVGDPPPWPRSRVVCPFAGPGCWVVPGRGVRSSRARTPG